MDKKKIKQQIIKIQRTGLTNMFDVESVQTIATKMKLVELTNFLKTNEDDYIEFIFTGKGLD